MTTIQFWEDEDTSVDVIVEECSFESILNCLIRIRSSEGLVYKNLFTTPNLFFVATRGRNSVEIKQGETKGSWSIALPGDENIMLSWAVSISCVSELGKTMTKTVAFESSLGKTIFTFKIVQWLNIDAGEFFLLDADKDRAVQFDISYISRNVRVLKQRPSYNHLRLGQIKSLFLTSENPSGLGSSALSLSAFLTNASLCDNGLETTITKQLTKLKQDPRWIASVANAMHTLQIVSRYHEPVEDALEVPRRMIIDPIFLNALHLSDHKTSTNAASGAIKDDHSDYVPQFAIDKQVIKKGSRVNTVGYGPYDYLSISSSSSRVIVREAVEMDNDDYIDIDGKYRLSCIFSTVCIYLYSIKLVTLLIYTKQIGREAMEMSMIQ